MIVVYILIGMWVAVITVECCQSRKSQREIERLKSINKTQDNLIKILKAELWQLQDSMRMRGK